MQPADPNSSRGILPERQMLSRGEESQQDVKSCWMGWAVCFLTCEALDRCFAKGGIERITKEVMVLFFSDLSRNKGKQVADRIIEWIGYKYGEVKQTIIGTMNTLRPKEKCELDFLRERGFFSAFESSVTEPEEGEGFFPAHRGIGYNGCIGNEEAERLAIENSLREIMGDIEETASQGFGGASSSGSVRGGEQYYTFGNKGEWPASNPSAVGIQEEGEGSGGPAIFDGRRYNSPVSELSLTDEQQLKLVMEFSRREYEEERRAAEEASGGGSSSFSLSMSRENGTPK